MATPTSGLSVRLPLLQALAVASASSSKKKKNSNSGGVSVSVSGGGPDEDSASTSEAVASLRIGRWGRRTSLLRKQREEQQQQKAPARNHNNKKRTRMQQQQQQPQPAPPNKKRRRLLAQQEEAAAAAAATAAATTTSAITLTSTARSGSSSGAGGVPELGAVVLRLLQSPAVGERRYAARWLLSLPSANGEDCDEYAAVCLKRSLRQRLVVGSSHPAEVGPPQQQQQRFVAELMAIWKELLVGGAGPTVAIVGACREDWTVVASQLLRFVSCRQMVAAAACADWCRHLVLLDTPASASAVSASAVSATAPSASEQQETKEATGGASEEENKDESKKEATTSSGNTKSIAQWRNQHWLWRKNLIPDSSVASEDNGPSLSPLACLVAAHYSLQDLQATAGLRGADTLRNILSGLVDPKQRVKTAAVAVPVAAVPAGPGGQTQNSSRKLTTAENRGSSSKKNRTAAAAVNGDLDSDVPPPLVPHRRRLLQHPPGSSVLEQLLNDTDHDDVGDEDEDDEDMESIVDEDEDDDEEGQDTPHEEEGEAGEANEAAHREAAADAAEPPGPERQPSQDDDDEYMPGQEPPEGVVQQGEGGGENDEDEEEEEDDGAGLDHDAEGVNEDDEGEGCDDEEEEEDDDDCDCADDDDDEDPMEIELSELEQGLISEHHLGLGHRSTAGRNNRSSNNKDDDDDSAEDKLPLAPSLDERKRLLIRAAMQVLEAHYPHLHHHHHHHSSSNNNAAHPHHTHQTHHSSSRRSDLLSPYSEAALLEGMNRIIKPPKKPLQTKIIMRRAPTQEEFFRGSLTRNPVYLSQLQPQAAGQPAPLSGAGGRGAGGRAVAAVPAPSSSHDSSYEPTVDDLRRYIARDLQMEDSAELLEILVANQIVDPSLKLRVVHQVVWRNHLMGNGANQHSSMSASLVSHSGLAMIFGSGFSDRLVSSSSMPGGRPAFAADTPLSQLPAMIATYRLAGVDGEATEDTVSTLVDPEAPEDAQSPEERELQLEQEYGLTRDVTATASQRGIYVLLRSIQHSIGDTLRRIRRDGAEYSFLGHRERENYDNPSRCSFSQQPPCAGLVLLRHCSQLASNRKLLLQARAPTVLLNLLLDVLKVLEQGCPTTSCIGGSGSGSGSGSSNEKNPTAEILQELIEILSSDISASNATSTPTSAGSGYESDSVSQDAASMPLLLESIEKISLSPPLRHIIAKLLPFLTYGQADLSQTLARHFDRNIVVESLGMCEQEEGERDEEQDNSSDDNSRVLMNTFVETAISLPPNPVCNSLRVELTHSGFIERLIRFVKAGLPKQPPAWSPALWDRSTPPPTAATAAAAAATSKGRKRTRRSSAAITSKESLDDAWRDFYTRKGVRTAIRVLTGLCKQHAPTQSRIVNDVDFVKCCHWLESTSDNTSANVITDGLGLLAETLLDEMSEGGNKDAVVKVIETTRLKTKVRKRELAQERRDQALLKMGSFRPGAAQTASTPPPPAAQQQPSTSSSGVRGAAASILAPVLGLFSNPSESSSSRGSASASSSRAKAKDASKAAPAAPPAEKPAWLTEMEAMEDDVGLTCVCCQEGRTLQPSELLGLYCYVKKVSIPFDQCGSRAGIDGTSLLRALPPTMPDTLVGDPVAEEWYLVGKAASGNLPSSASESITSSRKTTAFTTTVSAGNSIHFSCHRTARQADRNHPKAPKSEWEGAVLRNSRVNCNVILPLVSSQSSKVPLIAVDTALTDHQATLSNLVGQTPKSMLWHVLNDVRLLLLRMAYGEALNSDCGGGSLASNCQLVYYQLLMADMFDKDAQVDQPSQSQQAQGLPAGFLAACSMVSVAKAGGGTSDDPSRSLVRGIADAAPMAALTSVVFHNTAEDTSDGSSPEQASTTPNPKRLWLLGKDLFLRGLLVCGGRRQALGLEGSGCQTSRSRGGQRLRSSSFSEWEVVDDDDSLGRSVLGRSSNRAAAGASGSRRGQAKLSIDDFSNALRPMITMYAIIDQLSADFTLNMEDVQVEEKAQRLVQTIEECHRTKNIHELLKKADVTLTHEEIIDILQKGMMAA